MTNENLLSSKILKAKFCPNKSLWDAKFRKGNSWFWKDFIEAMNFINDTVGRIIGNGESISVWKCNWIPCEGGLMRPLSDVSNPSLVFKYLLDQDYNWNMQFLRTVFNNEANYEGITKMYISRHNRGDTRIWSFAKNGILSTNTIYNSTLRDSNVRCTSTLNWKIIWPLLLPQIVYFGCKCLKKGNSCS